jgi:hypothetical protein
VTDEPDLTHHHERATMQMLARAVRERWDIPQGMRSRAGQIAAKLAFEGRTDRERLRAIELLAALDRDNIAALVALDKVERLESGQATERIELAPVSLKPTSHGEPDAQPPSPLPGAVPGDL